MDVYGHPKAKELIQESQIQARFVSIVNSKGSLQYLLNNCLFFRKMDTVLMVCIIKTFGLNFVYRVSRRLLHNKEPKPLEMILE